MKKLFAVLLLSSLSCSNSSFAVNSNLTGVIKFEGGGSAPSGSNTIGSKDARGTIYSEAGINVVLENEVHKIDGNPIKYGGRLVLQTTARTTGSASLNGTHIFIKSDIGTIELGSPYSATSKMQIRSVACGGGGGWMRYLDLPKQLRFLHSSTLPLDAFSSNMLGCDDTEATRKISYYIPECYGLSAGISFIPDSSNSNGNLYKETTGKDEILKLSDDRYVNYRPSVKNAFAVAMNYKHELQKDTSIKIGGALQFGTVEPLNVYNQKETSIQNKLSETIKLKDVLAYSVGAILTHQNISFSASYGSVNDSLNNHGSVNDRLNNNKPNKNEIEVKPGRYFWCLGASYSIDKAKISLTWFNSTHGDNKMNTITLGSEYELADGLSTYLDIGYFAGKGYAIIKDDKNDVFTSKYDSKLEHVSGIGALLGIALKF